MPLRMNRFYRAVFASTLALSLTAAPDPYKELKFRLIGPFRRRPCRGSYDGLLTRYDYRTGATRNSPYGLTIRWARAWKQ